MPRKKGRFDKPLIARFQEKYEVQDNGCWHWTAFIDKAGYGRIHDAGQFSESLYAHRVSYEHYKGAIPEGYDLDHLCRNRWCVNPDHLEAVPHSENAIRGMHPKVVIYRQQVCKRGHPYEGNRYYHPQRSGIASTCRVCRNLLRRQKRANQAKEQAQ